AAAVGADRVPGAGDALLTGRGAGGGDGDAVRVLVDPRDLGAVVDGDAVAVLLRRHAQFGLHRRLVDVVETRPAAQRRRRMLDPHDLLAVVGHPAERSLRLDDPVDPLVDAEVLEDPHRPVVDGHGTRPRIDVRGSFEGDGRDAVPGEGQCGDHAGRAVPDDRAVRVLALGHAMAPFFSSRTSPRELLDRTFGSTVRRVTAGHGDLSRGPGLIPRI